MFHDGDQVKVKTTLPFDEVSHRVEGILEDLGPVHFMKSGRFSIERGRLSSSWTDVGYDGEIRERKDGQGYLIFLDYEVKPSTTCLVLGILGFLFCGGLGALLLLFPALAKGEVQRLVRRVMDDIEDELTR
jgi:hypothetical protein